MNQPLLQHIMFCSIIKSFFPHTSLLITSTCLELNQTKGNRSWQTWGELYFPSIICTS